MSRPKIRVQGRLAALVARLARLETDAAKAPKFTKAVVIGTGPLRIRIDGDTQPLAGTPDSIVTGLAVNHRVLVLIQNGKATVIGQLQAG